MSEKGWVERETGGSRKDLARAQSFKDKHHGYFHNLDQIAVSFFVTNFPKACSVEELWKLFAGFGRVGDVYIPNKVETRGRRFCFVKFREVKELKELNSRLQDVWLGNFKLRVNKSRFGRNEESKKKPVSDPLVTAGKEECNIHQGASFKSALMNSKQVVMRGGSEEAVQVEVEETILKELQQSFVGVLVLSIELSRIKTILYMEGFARISITDMGRNLVLLFSPKVGELEKLCKSKPDWFSYYFKLVRPWSPSLFADRRDVWVKVFGIPLHVWGEILFKCIGKRYGDFLDFDDKTASRSKLDVARLKISTFFRGVIDEPMKIKAMGVEYTIWITEDKGFEPVFVHKDGLEDHDQSWVDSAIYPAEANEELGSAS
ncbi:zinc finger CCCH domain-containing protein [Trifolium repens]|nr:zinc finger CCCH domain-containing protein [Trifolium repens]